MRKAIVAGSFDPFTNGHLTIVKKAAAIFDEVIVAIGTNVNKKRNYDSKEMCEAINKTLIFSGLTNCKCVVVSGPIATYCEDNDIKYTVRGLRNNMDFHYESEITKINRLINPKLETVYLPADNDAISSSMVREFLQLNLSIKDYVPSDVLKFIYKMK
jgi:pantetheine-phosphate adenylyltransferase